MLTVLQNKSLELLENLVHTLESYEGVEKRPRVFAKKEEQQESDQKENQSDSKDQKASDVNGDQHEEDMAPAERFKQLSYELLDIGLF